MSQYVLVVDDDMTVGRIVARTLRDLELKVHVVNGPSSAWGFLHRETNAPALLITDVHLGTGDGRHLAWQLRLLYPGLPVVLMSGGFDSANEPKVQGRGPQRFIAKPFQAEVLRVAVQEILFESGTGTKDGNERG